MIRNLIQLLQQSNYTVVFTGAGMSTESGLPDFRSQKQGLWEKFDPKQLASTYALKNHPQQFTAFYQMRIKSLTKHKPHEGHKILANWEKKGLIQCIVTQNVDGFHRDAGNNNVLEIHGSLTNLYCNTCLRAYPTTDYLERDGTCTVCNQLIRPGVVLFGEALPEDVLLQAEQEMLKADLVLVLGSSLTVSPANLLPQWAFENGAKLIIVNEEPTPLDQMATYVIQDWKIKELLVNLHKSIQ